MNRWRSALIVLIASLLVSWPAAGPTKGKTIVPGLSGLHGHVGRSEGLAQDEEYFNRARIQRDANQYLYFGITHRLSL